eukprot:TRINITY_DN73185_c0_g1_i1.p1 TRINITY_DN73185_c0_g1~~TRINITY_DN73185_c0_g1_i1.p1  ORF type:complete len:639 (+),score=112.58 TRINITY_DN73185_c0_g1_i1:57-1973(+)
MAPKSKSKAKAQPKQAAGARRPQTVEDKVKKAIADSLKGMTHNQLYVKVSLVTNITCFDRMMDDHNRKAAGEVVPFGHNYYKNLRLEYGDASNPMVALKANTAEPVPAPLIKAVLATQKSHPDRSLLQAWLASAGTAPCQPAVVGLLKLFWQLRLGCSKQMMLAVEFIEFYIRVSLQTTNPAEWAHVHSKVEEVLDKMHSSFRGPDDSTAHQFIVEHFDALCLVINRAQLTNLRDANGVYDDVLESLNAAVGSSIVGGSLFGSEMGKWIAKEIEKVCNSKLFVFCLKKEITKDAVQHVMDEILSNIQQLDNLELLEPSRTVFANYRGFPVSKTVTSYQQEVLWRVALVWKGLARQKNLLPALWCEDIVIPSPKTSGTANVCKDLCAPAVRAREACNQIFAVANVSSSDQVVATMNANIANLKIKDRSFDVEESIIKELSGERADARLLNEVQELMPSATKERDPLEVIQELNALMKGNVFKYATTGVQGKLESMRTAIGRLGEGRDPELVDLLSDATLKQFVASFVFFLRAKVKEGSKTKVLVGSSAALHLFRLLDEKFSSNTAKPEDLTAIKPWVHLLPEDVLGRCKLIIDRVEGTPVEFSGPKAKKRKVVASNTAGSSSAASSEDVAMTKTLSLFA